MTPTKAVAIIHKPANEAYVIPMGSDFITFDKAYIHKIIVTALAILGTHCEKPSAFFAKLFDAVPKTIAKSKKR
tara:strand:+ start:396 stop:617 length:222 start_codon:yes stop_codon:yes gene_type:complete